VESCAAENPAIAADIEFQKNLKDALKPDEAAFKPGELDWARLSKSMEQEGQVPEYAAQKKPQFWRYAAAILAVAAIKRLRNSLRNPLKPSSALIPASRKVR